MPRADTSLRPRSLALGVACMTSEPGTYLLVLRADSPRRIAVGRWGVLDVRTGYHLYFGSAFRPGGVSARVSRHCREAQVKHWHVDYLRDVAAPVEVWFGCGSRDLEHRWAESLIGMRGVSSVPGFGCSDCNCESHLFVSAGKPEFEWFCGVAGTRVEHCRIYSMSLCGVSTSEMFNRTDY